MILYFIQLEYNDSITILMDLVLNSLTSSTTRLHFQQKNRLSNRFDKSKGVSFLVFEKKSVSTMSWLFAELLSCARDYTQRVKNAETAVRQFSIITF